MSKIVDVINNCEKMRSGKAPDVSEITNAENTLGLQFAPEYKEYVKQFGFATYVGHELTGICKSPRLNVADVTIEAREQYVLDSDMYVIEETEFDGILILQNHKGEIFKVQPGTKPMKIASSLTDYILDK